MPVKRKRRTPLPVPVVIEAPPARNWQLAGAAARRNAVDEKLASALSAMDAELARGELTGVLTYADVLRRAGIDRKTLFSPKFPGRAGLVDGFLRKAGATPKAKQPAKPKKPTFYERISVNAQEAEAVRLLKQAEIDTLESKLSAALEQIAVFRAARLSQQRKKDSTAAKHSVQNGNASFNLGA
jgi:predicted DNA-binding protein (UPF0251 family)